MIHQVATNAEIPEAFKVALDPTIITSLVARSVTVSVPASALKVSLPAPPVKVSLSAPPVISSLPLPPEIISAPAPPESISFPSAPILIISYYHQLCCQLTAPPVKVKSLGLTGKVYCRTRRIKGECFNAYELIISRKSVASRR